MYDQIAEEGGPIFEARNDSIARRIISTMSEVSLPPGSKKSDFRLYKLGNYNRGDEKARPYLTAFEKSVDITEEVKFDETV